MQKNIPIQINNHKELLNLISQGYGSLSRTLMEYIDNSFDDADEYLFNQDEQKYIRDISITIEIDRSKNSISVTDNCMGMDTDSLAHLANKINDSVKKNKKGTWVNGRFALGAHAFRLFASNLTVVSKKSDNPEHIISIEKNDDNAILSSSKKNIIEATGTKVTLNNIERNQLKNLTVGILKNDIEIHFETLLNRNVKIVIKDEVNEVVCEPYNYDEIEGIPIKKNISQWKISENNTTKVPDDKAIVINLKVCKQPNNRPVYISGIGRKIGNVLDVKSFNNYVNNYGHKRNIWSNPLITGYIEIKDNLKPVVHRDDFEPLNGKRSAIYSEILKLEDEIFEAIQREMQNKTDEGMRTLSDELTAMLSKLANEDNLALRKLEEENKKSAGEKVEVPFIEDKESETTFTVNGGNEHGDGDQIDNPGMPTEVNGTQDESGERMGSPSRPKKQGLQIEFMVDGSGDRSYYSDGIIYIYMDHPDFQTRIQQTRGGELSSMKITARLANYLAAIISSKYKEQFYQSKKINPDRDRVLDEQIDFIFRFESLMQNFIDQRLDKIGDIAK